MLPINPWLIVAAAFAAVAIFTDTKKKGDSDGNNRENESNGSGDNCDRQQSPADSQHHGQDLETSNGDVFDLSKTEQGNTDEKVSADNEPISPLGTGDGGDDCGSESRTADQSGS